MMRDEKITLHDGRQLAYTDTGDPSGTAILFFHGTPGCRLVFADEEKLMRNGLRLIAPDRPGFGLSDRKPGRTLLDWPDDVAALADALGLDRFAVAGVSGGGAFAAACACRLPERLFHVSLIASTMPFENGKPPLSMMRENRMAFALSRYAPWLLRASYRAQARMIDRKPEKFIAALKGGNKHLSEADRASLQADQSAAETMQLMREAIRQGPEEAVAEPTLLTKPWGFDLADIPVHVHVWHGEQDRMAPFDEAVRHTVRIPNRTLHTFPDAAHFLTDDEAIWNAILETIRTEAP